VRWQAQTLDAMPAGPPTLPLTGLGAVERRFDTPEFRGVTFYEVRAKSVLNRVPDTSPVPFRWTVNPYRGCTHACVYCFARRTHTYLDLDAGADFDSRVVVKVNAGEVLARELASPRWTGERVALGTNVDPYQRAEGRYRVTRDVLEALVEAGNPFSILTKGTLVLRDLDLLQAGARRAAVSVTTSVGSVDQAIWRSVEPGTPGPNRRLRMIGEVARAGLGGGVLMAPVLPYLTDSDEQLEETVGAAAAAGATWLSPLVLRLPAGAREWWAEWLAREHPDKVDAYRALYRGRASVPRSFEQDLYGRVHELAARYGLRRERPGRSGHEGPGPERTAAAAPQVGAPEQLTLV
jgi:DNA repair photolyase